MTMNANDSITNTSGMNVSYSLNIVAQPFPTKAVTPIQRPNRKKNKYERRRQKSDQANIKTSKSHGRSVINIEKNLSDTEKVQESSTSSCREDQKPLINTAVTTSNTKSTSHTIKSPPRSHYETNDPQQKEADDENVKSTTAYTIKSPPITHTETTDLSSSDCINMNSVIESNKPHNASSPGKANESSSPPRKKEHPILTASNTPTITRKNPTNGDNIAITYSEVDAATASRAAYMAEYHARPMELDRRAGIRSFSNNYSQAVGVGTKSINDGKDPSDSANRTWENLSLHKRLISAIQHSLGSTSNPTLIQYHAIPILIAQQQNNESIKQTNVFLHSETGSGKTLAYLLPVLQSMMMTSTSLKVSRFEYGTRCVILCPTRELAVQTTIACERMCRAAGLMHIVPGCLGGGSGNNNKDSANIDSRSTEKVRLRKGLGIIVATPGRLLDHLTRTESLRTTVKRIQYMVFDEVDRLFDSGLGQQIKQIIEIIRSLIAERRNTTSFDHTLSHVPNENFPWRSIFVSATVTDQVQALAKDMLSNQSDDTSITSTSWIVVSGKGDNDCNKIRTTIPSLDEPPKSEHKSNISSLTSISSSATSFADSSPKQLIQLHITCSAKLRLTALISFLLDRTVKGETTVVFVSTCAAVDYYHTLLTSMDCIIPDSNVTSSQQKGIFGNKCHIYKLHGNVPQGERQNVLNNFKKAASHDSINHATIVGKFGSVLFATDVAARGLNLPSVDWIVQFDVPCDVADYVHRAGRVARAGCVGHAVLFLLPSEKDFLTVLQQRGIANMSAMSLTSVLNTAAAICKPITEQGIIRGGGSLQKDSTNGKSSRLGEAFCIELQHRLEDCVVRDDITTKEKAKKEKKSKARSVEPVSGELVDMARNAFLSYIRAYPTKEKSIRHIFAAKALHLGHVARSFALKDPPTKVVAASQTLRKRKHETLDFSNDESDQMRKKKLSFHVDQRKPSKKTDSRRVAKGRNEMAMSTDSRSTKVAQSGNGRSLLMANAAKLQSNGLDGL
jgi:ATP-dependent RNA helicase DDX31/DBP7